MEKKNSTVLFFQLIKKNFVSIFSRFFNLISEKINKKTVPRMVKSHPWAGYKKTLNAVTVSFSVVGLIDPLLLVYSYLKEEKKD
jgi:hypothetical protein